MIDNNGNDKNKTLQSKALLADAGLLTVAMIWGGGFVAMKMALSDMNLLSLSMYRYVGGAILMTFFVLNKLKDKELMSNKKLWVCGLACGVNMFIGNGMQMAGLQFTMAGKQSFIIAMYIILVPIMSWIVFRKKPSNYILLAAVIGFIGIALITLTDNFRIGIGDALSFGLTLTYSAQIIFTTVVVKDMDVMLFTYIQVVVMAVLFTILSLVTGTLMTPAEVISMSQPALIGLIYTTILNSVIAFSIHNAALGYAPPGHAAVLLSMESVFGVTAAILIAGEVFTGRMIIGGILMFVAIGIVEYQTVKNNLAE